jgi:hypothetical protein
MDKNVLGRASMSHESCLRVPMRDVLMTGVGKVKLHLNASLYTLLQILSVSIFEKTEISCALQPDVRRDVSPPPDNQLILFDF